MTRLILVALLAVTACAPVYVPNVRNSPMFTKAGEFQASVQVGNGLEGQGAFAVADHFGVIANYSFNDDTDHANKESFLRHSFFEGGAGYFSNKEDSFFEIFAGYGRGKGTTFDTYGFLGTQAVASTGRYHRYFLQPAFGLNKNDLHFSFAPRLSMVDFYEFSTELVRTTVEEQPKFFFEPAFIGKANFANNHLFAIFQAGVSLGLSEDVYFDRRTFQISGGLGFRLGGAKRLVSRL
ncbi:MAG TPA: hypothetical protein VIQ51_15980 [Chryseosolibacter sp.]|jgi:hypothetical protein